MANAKEKTTTLKECKTRQEVEEFFETAESKTLKNKMTFLMEAMNNPEFFFQMVNLMMKRNMK